jgi:hypothetical protein
MCMTAHRTGEHIAVVAWSGRLFAASAPTVTQASKMITGLVHDFQVGLGGLWDSRTRPLLLTSPLRGSFVFADEAAETGRRLIRSWETSATG